MATGQAPRTRPSVPSRNAEPVVFLDAVPDPSGMTTVRLADGREFLDANLALPQEDVERIRDGWVCIRCYEPQSQQFPEVCEQPPPPEGTGCGFPMRSLQAEEFAKMYKGSVKLGSNIDLADEVERMRQLDEYEQRTGIILPPKVRNNIV